jgi:hypothetical protein
MDKLNFKKGTNTKLVSFKVDPQTSQNLTALRNLYRKEANRRITTGQIVKQLINIHYDKIIGENNE